MFYQDILDLIKQRQGISDPESIERKERRELERSMKQAPLSADDFQMFKKKFVDEYGGEKIKNTGMTHSEFLLYLKDGTREGESQETQSLREFLQNLEK